MLSFKNSEPQLFRSRIFKSQQGICPYNSLFADFPLHDKDVFAHFALNGKTVTRLDGTIGIASEYLYVLEKDV